jgi:hypothetical protein
MVDPLQETFPHLATSGYRITSPKSKSYNCIAHALGDESRWWWPDIANIEAFWPADVPRVETLEAFRAAFATLGFAECTGADFEAGFERVAIFAIKGSPTHAARQLPDGLWTSKLGELEDIEHELHGLEGEAYGGVALLMKRPR